MNRYDELNINTQRSIPYRRYFSEMRLTESQIKERISFAEEFEDIMFYILALISAMSDSGQIDTEYLQEQLGQRYETLANTRTNIDSEFEKYISEFSNRTIDSTLENLTEPYFTSDDRCRYVAENESNTFYEHKEYAEATEIGKTKKTWVSMRDEKVRVDHQLIDGKTIPINEPFIIGTSHLMYPKDTSLGADPNQIIGCRCHARYS